MRLESERSRMQQREVVRIDDDDDGDASSAFLLCAASQLLCDAEAHCDDDGDDHRTADVSEIVDFPSFQALLHAATTVATAAAPKQPSSKPPARVSVASSSNVNAHTKKRRERNRISCRKTRLKRKVEQLRADVLARKRTERNAYLQDLHRTLQLAPSSTNQRSSSSPRERERIAREFVARSAHFALVDATYDASWCFAPDSATASRTKLPASRPLDVLAAQWQAATSAYEVADLTILCVTESATNDNDDSGAELKCAWRIIGVTKHDLSLGHVVEHVVYGETTVRFSGQRIESTDLRLATSLSAHAVCL